jgi:hypothetical protein
VTIKYVPPVKKTDLKSLICDGKEHRLDIGDLTPDVAAVLFAGTYVNVDSFDLKTTQPARLQIWMRRVAFGGEAADDTFHNDLWLTREGYVHHDWETMFEKCEKGRALRWYYKINGANSVKIDTRYIKYALVY